MCLSKGTSIIHQIMGSETLPSLPVIDFTVENLSPGSSLWLKTAEEVRNALEEYGCFIAINKEVSSELKDATFQELKHMFDLPTEIKSKNVCNTLIPHFSYRGPFPGFPLMEAIGITDVTDDQSVQSFTNRLWPSGNHQFCETMNSFIKSGLKVHQMTTKMIFESYGVEKYLDSHAAMANYSLRCVKYRVPDEGATNVGARAHTDKGFLTVIHQNEVDGVEVQTKNGDHWVAMELPPSSCIVLAGEGFLAWSNGRVHSVVHRVGMIGAKETRYSTVLFSTIHGETDIPQELIDDDHPRQFTSFDGYALQLSYFTEEGLKTENTARAYCGV